MVSNQLRRALNGTGAPAAVVDLDAFDANLDALAAEKRSQSDSGIRVAVAIGYFEARKVSDCDLFFGRPLEGRRGGVSQREW